MMESEAPHFNLIDEPWIPVSMTDGSFGEVSLRELFKKATSIRTVAGDIPQQVAPILRLCLAVVYRAYTLAREECLKYGDEVDPVELWREAWEDGTFDLSLLDSYFDQVHNRFDLFGPKPFMQVAGLEYAAKECDPVSEFIADVPKPEKFLFSMRSKSAPETITFAEAARWLLFCLAFDCAGIKSPVVGNTHVTSGRVYAPKGISSIGWLGEIGTVFIQGSNLFETLMLNWAICSDPKSDSHLLISDDIPAWELPVQSADSEVYTARGPVGLFTVLDRRIRLVVHESKDAVKGIIVCYGEIVQPIGASRYETMTAWYESTAKQKELSLPRAPLLPKAHDASKALWRGLGPLLQAEGEGAEDELRPGVVRWIGILRDEGVEDLPGTLCLHAQGIEYGTQSSVITNAYDDELDIADILVRTDSGASRCAVGSLNRMERAVDYLVELARDVEMIAGARTVSGRYLDDIREEAYLALDPLMRQRLRDFPSDCSPEDYCAAWRVDAKKIIASIGGRFLSKFPQSRFERREKREDKQANRRTEGGSIAEAERRFNRKLKETLGV